MIFQWNQFYPQTTGSTHNQFMVCGADWTKFQQTGLNVGSTSEGRSVDRFGGVDRFGRPTLGNLPRKSHHR